MYSTLQLSKTTHRDVFKSGTLITGIGHESMENFYKDHGEDLDYDEQRVKVVIIS